MNAFGGAIIGGFLASGSESLVAVLGSEAAGALGAMGGAVTATGIFVGIPLVHIILSEAYDQNAKEKQGRGAGGGGGVGGGGGTGGAGGTHGSHEFGGADPGHTGGIGQEFYQNSTNPRDYENPTPGAADGSIGGGQQGSRWTPFYGPGSLSYDNDLSSDLRRQRQEQRRRKEQQDWNEQHKGRGGQDSQGRNPNNPGDDPPPPDEPPPPDDAPSGPDDPGGPGGPEDGGGSSHSWDASFDFLKGLSKKSGPIEQESYKSSQGHLLAFWAGAGHGVVSADEQTGWGGTHPKANEEDPGQAPQPGKKGRSGGGKDEEGSRKGAEVMFGGYDNPDGWYGSNHPKMLGILSGKIGG